MSDRTEIPAWVSNPGVEGIDKAWKQNAPDSISWVVTNPDPQRLDYTDACRSCAFVRQSSRNRATCQRQFLARFEQSKKELQPVLFECPAEKQAVIFPVQQKGHLLGYWAVCNRGKIPDLGQVSLTQSALVSVGRELEKTDELKTLSETLQPRCAALATVHTVHRLISSMLNTEELIPRVARLSCQVMRAQACSIWLTDPVKQKMIPKAEVRIGRGRFTPARASRIGTGIIGRVAGSCKSHLEPFLIAVPMMEEESIGVISVERARSSKPFTVLDHEILTTLAEQAVVAIRNAQLYETQERVTWGTIRSLSAILDKMDNDAAHLPSTQVLADVALAIARQMRLPELQQRSLHYAAMLHNAGRLGIPTEILHKSGSLTDQEFEQVRAHPARMVHLLGPLEILEPAVPIILYHHERYDGTGYPKGLKKDAIPLGARILAVANALEAMISERPYRPAMTLEQAAAEIGSHAKSQFDPEVVDAFLTLVKQGVMERTLADSPAQMNLREIRR